MSPIRCIRFILFRVSCDLSALLFLCGRFQKNTKFEGWADHVTGKAGEGFRAWCSEYIPILWRDQPTGFVQLLAITSSISQWTAWTDTFLFIGHLASSDHWTVQSRKCMQRLKFHQPTFMPRQYVGTQFTLLSLNNPGHHIYATQEVSHQEQFSF